MMDNIRKAFREEVADLTWIDNETKPRVYEKVTFSKLLCMLTLSDCIYQNLLVVVCLRCTWSIDDIMKLTYYNENIENLINCR